jgi:hypothetical protein
MPVVYKWQAAEINTTITAATVYNIVDPSGGTVRKSTIFNEIPSGYTVPPMNSDGTQVRTIKYTRNKKFYTTML